MRLPPNPLASASITTTRGAFVSAASMAQAAERMGLATTWRAPTDASLACLGQVIERLQRLFRAGPDGDAFRQVHPADDAARVNQEFGGAGDVGASQFFAEEEGGRKR